MLLLTNQEIEDVDIFIMNKDTFDMKTLGLDFARAIESAVLTKIKAQGPVAWLHNQRTDSDVVTDAVKSVWGKAAVGSLASYSVPLYKLPEGD